MRIRLSIWKCNKISGLLYFCDGDFLARAFVGRNSVWCVSSTPPPITAARHRRPTPNWLGRKNELLSLNFSRHFINQTSKVPSFQQKGSHPTFANVGRKSPSSCNPQTQLQRALLHLHHALIDCNCSVQNNSPMFMSDITKQVKKCYHQCIEND